MNLEQEREKFEAAIPAELKHVNFVINESSVGLLNSLEEAFFEVWLAAKEHAAEMAKPAVRIEKTYPRSEQGWCVYRDSDSFLHIDCSKEAAIKWAVDAGYRVIEE